MLQPRQHNLLTRLLDLASEEHLIENRVDLKQSINVSQQLPSPHINFPAPRLISLTPLTLLPLFPSPPLPHTPANLPCRN